MQTAQRDLEPSGHGLGTNFDSCTALLESCSVAGWPRQACGRACEGTQQLHVLIR